MRNFLINDLCLISDTFSFHATVCMINCTLHATSALCWCLPGHSVFPWWSPHYWKYGVNLAWILQHSLAQSSRKMGNHQRRCCLSWDLYCHVLSSFCLIHAFIGKFARAKETSNLTSKLSKLSHLIKATRKLKRKCWE